jgi:ABC-type uncharacterized transport system permease subunit
MFLLIYFFILCIGHIFLLLPIPSNFHLDATNFALWSVVFLCIRLKNVGVCLVRHIHYCQITFILPRYVFFNAFVDI